MLIAAILLALGTVLARQSSGGGSFGVNTAGGPGTLASAVMPDFTLSLVDGATLKASDLEGRPAVLNFWASWCVPCQEEAPLFARMAREYEAENVAFLGISEWDTESDLRAFLARYGVGYKNGVDLGGKTAIEFGVTGIPETFFVRADGSLASRWIGPLDEDQLRKLVREIQT
ncbi:MAG TPA: redoxin domain-containing protein [Chloroflexota bacterium]|nr:redoxin domain-containing protein [Chloroflexota bacterium]